MEDARSYLISTAPATEGLFGLLNEYGWQKMRAFVDLANSKTRAEFEERKEVFSSTDVAKEVIAGSILQIAYVAIERYAVQKDKSKKALRFEAEINQLIRENQNTRWKSKKSFVLPDKFCVGRDIGNLPLGVIVFAGRNQYNHYADKRLNVLNEIVFNHLHDIWPSPPNELSFNIYEAKRPRSYSILAALEWTDTTKELGYFAYKRDLCEILQVEF